MPSKYPEIITELIKYTKCNGLRHFDLSSFTSDKSFEDVFEKIDKTMQFFAVYVVMERLEDDLWEDSRYTEKEKVHLCSLVEAKAREYWWNRNREHLKIIDERLELLKNDPEHKDMIEGDLRDKIIEDLNQEVHPVVIERLKDDWQEI